MDRNLSEYLKRLLFVVNTLEPLQTNIDYFLPISFNNVSYMAVKAAHELTKENQPTHQQQNNHPHFLHTVST